MLQKYCDRLLYFFRISALAYFERDLYGEDAGEEVIEVVEHLVSKWVRAQWVLGCQHCARDENADQNEVGEVRVVDDGVAEHPERVRVRKDKKWRRFRNGYHLKISSEWNKR